MTVAVGDILRIVMNFTWDGGSIQQNVYNCKIGGSGGPFDAQDVCDDMADWMDNLYDNVKASMSQDLTSGLATVYVWDPVDGDWDELGSGNPAFSCSSVGDVLPYGIAAMIRANSTDPDVQGRKYLGGFTEDQQSDGSWGASPLTYFLAFGADWVAQFVGSTSGATFDPGVWSASSSTFYAFIANYIVNAIANYQRRRRPGVGI